MRLFVAVEVPLEHKELLTKLYTPGREGGVLWVAPDTIHITAAFLGEVEPGRLEAVNRALQKASRAVPPFVVEAGGVGCFPNARSPKVIWIGVRAGSEELERLTAAIARGLREEGMAVEGKRFHAHLTLGRVKDEEVGPRTVRAKLAAWEGLSLPPWTVSSVSLMRSTLRPVGAVYETLGVFPCGG